MNLATCSPMFTKEELSILLRRGINNRIVRALENRHIPWQKPWEGRGKGVGYPRDVATGKKFFGINFLLLQMSAREHGFVSGWWATANQFSKLGSEVKSRPESVPIGAWPTETILYKMEADKVLTVSSIVYNSDQLSSLLENYSPNPKLMPVYDAAERVLHSTKAKIKYNATSEAWYFYPPKDFITMPTKAVFENGFGGLPGYYESLAHELIHWTESRLGFNTDCNEAVRELRADIGAAMLVEELGVPHSISFFNFNKWYINWINLMKHDADLIFKVCASASKAVDYILKSDEARFNQIDESVA